MELHKLRPLGPLGSVEPTYPSNTSADITVTAAAQKLVVNPKTGLRDDGRKPSQSRPLYIKLGAVSGSKGSAFCERAGTKIVCAVYGPREMDRSEGYSDKGRLSCEFDFSPSAKPFLKSFQIYSTMEERELASVIESTLTMSVQLQHYPKSVIDINISVIHDDGGVLPLAITCASLALGHSGVLMYDMVAASKIGFVNKNNKPLTIVDCTKEEEMNCDSVMTVAQMPIMNDVTSVIQNGELDIKAVKRLYDTCLDNNTIVYQDMQKALKELLLNP